jgi:hypothetical protein
MSRESVCLLCRSLKRRNHAWKPEAAERPAINCSLARIAPGGQPPSTSGSGTEGRELTQQSRQAPSAARPPSHSCQSHAAVHVDACDAMRHFCSDFHAELYQKALLGLVLSQPAAGELPGPQPLCPRGVEGRVVSGSGGGSSTGWQGPTPLQLRAPLPPLRISTHGMCHFPQQATPPQGHHLCGREKRSRAQARWNWGRGGGSARVPLIGCLGRLAASAPSLTARPLHARH